MSETFEQAIERCLMDGTTAKALRLIAADFDDESNGFIEIAALQQGADGLDTLVARVADLSASRDRASDACASVQRERDALRDAMQEICCQSNEDWAEARADPNATLNRIHEIAVDAFYGKSE